MSARLAHAFVFVCNLDHVARFYEGVFGMRREPSSDAGFVIMRGSNGDAGIAIHALRPEIAAQMALTDPPRWRDDTAYKICFEVDDLTATRALILTNGGLAKDPWSWEGTTFCECTDPEGNVVQIFRRS